MLRVFGVKRTDGTVTLITVAPQDKIEKQVARLLPLVPSDGVLVSWLVYEWPFVLDPYDLANVNIETQTDSRRLQPAEVFRFP